jgi:leucyl-tRNA synthetase
MSDHIQEKKHRSEQHEVNNWPTYNPQAIEPKWQQRWEKDGLYIAHDANDKQKYYCMDFFPYPSGDGLHVGHCRNYIPTDVLSRYKRMQGYNVLHPMGWDAFGEPTEQFAVTHGIQPRETTDRNTANFRRQMTIIGTSYDWTREIDSSKPEYYRWTQWFFLLMYKHNLVYRDLNWQWWCPTCQTTLSSHEVIGGVCWRGHTGITKREIPAWYFRITAYADELLSGLDEIDWPEHIKVMQRNWIGRSSGCEIDFHTETGESVPVFTTRPDTIYGVTFFVLAPEHPLVHKITTPENRLEVSAYISEAVKMSEIDRMSEAREKTGVFTGGYVINPFNDDRVPVWIADYVLISYGTGAVMGVPAHDQRDFEFAGKYHLPVKVVIASDGYKGETLEKAYTGAGSMVNSGPFDGLQNEVGIDKGMDYLEEHSLGRRTVLYRMRDWLISRQRYWGTPIPVIYCEDCGEVPVPEEQLPVLLPPMDNFLPDGSGLSPLSRVPEFVNATCPKCGGPARRETDTMGGFACSSWYFLRFTSPHYDKGPFNPATMKYWMPVDLYVGGAEHAVLHLLYARFWTKVLADAGLLPFREPFTKLLNQGQLMGPDGHRMSKSRGNVITPDSMVETYGADALRIYEMFIAPFDQDITWSTEGINGARRFLNRIWTLYTDTYNQSASATDVDSGLERLLHKTIRRVSERIDTLRFNTMVSILMEFVNALAEKQRAGTWNTASYHYALETLLTLIAPAVPHIAEELWELTGHPYSVHQQSWPVWEDELAKDEIVQVAVQVDSKVRGVIDVMIDASQEDVLEQAYLHPRVQQHLQGRKVMKVFYVPGKILNIVTQR